ncbi:serine/threonine-protein kinase [Bythopirellula polymerisocia]|uniref:non-specific serine/threonine protein kinase n=1 Tax=Bythopirellula polymerisocia TaxID=2528003 RepID=A0A5C6CZN1_9BACT|nr:serine/threonine-protein kinase [Bythopirellula polymerisocia]TWU28466.1 Serine/threonine-protein kinase PknB [Bythopirellula polymerisocia]
MIPKRTADPNEITQTHLLHKLDQICDRFEEAWCDGLHPLIEDYIEGLQEPLRTRLLQELVALEVSYRRESGQTPVASEYESRFTNDTAIVREGLGVCRSTAQVETGPLDRTEIPSLYLDIRCPSCNAPTQVAVDTPLTELICKRCGIHFSLVDQSHTTQRAPPLSQLGRFELVERLGVGSFGSVWKARDKELDRMVAIKIPRQGMMTSEEKERFFHEARAAAQLHHPNIVSVHEVGRDGESIYIVSDFVHGLTLSDWLTDQKLTGREAAELCAKVAEAVHYAHEQGVIHRDLKPANIMIDGDREPHLMDFGLARRDMGEMTVTIDGQLLGTPAYMSPEQAQGEAHKADRRSDIYSLGVILFQLLTGELPFRGNTRMLIHQVINDEPPSPRKLNANVSHDLETITLKCLEKEPQERYANARELADELQRYLRGEPIHARPLSRLERCWRLCQRRPLVAGLSAAIVFLLIAATLSATVAAARFRSLALEREQALVKETSARKEAEDVTDFALEMLQTPSRFDSFYDSQDFSVAELCQQASVRVRERFSGKPAIAARLQFALAKLLFDLGKFPSSQNLASEAAELSQAVNGSDSETTLMAERLVASCLRFQGQFKAARLRYEELATRAEHTLGSRHPAYLLVCTDLATVYAEQLQPQAIDWIEKVIPYYTTALPEEHPDRRFIVNRAGWVYCMLGKFELGRKYFEETLRLRRKYDGRLAHATLRVQHANLAWALTNLGRHEEAITNQIEALRVFQEKYPDDPSRWLWPQSYLIHRYVCAEQYDAAIGAAVEFLQNCRNCLENPDNHDSWTVWELHDALYQAGHVSKAEGLSEQITECLRHVLGENDLAVHRSALRHLRSASQYDSIDDDVERIVSKVQKLFTTQRQLLGDGHPQVAKIATVLASGLALTSTSTRSQWSELLDWSASATARKPDESEILYQAAIVSLAQNNLREYRQHCAEMMSQFRETGDEAIAERAVRACVAAPDSTPAPEEVVHLARVTEQPCLIGATLYRAYEYDQALENLNAATDAGHKYGPWDYAFRAMTLQKLDQPDGAKQSFLMAQQITSQVSTWQEEVEVAHLIREVEALLKSVEATMPASELHGQ